MENLHALMRVLDEHADAMPQGDYLAACDHMKEVFIALTAMSSPPPRECVHFSQDLMERHRVNRQDIHTNSLAHIECARVYQGLKLGSRITRAVQIEAGSEDREMCVKFLEKKNLGIRLKRQGVEKRISVLENEMETFRTVQMMIKLEMDREVAAWQREHPGVEGIIRT